MKIFGAFLLGGGFIWIVFLSLWNPVMARIGWSDDVAFVYRQDTFTAKETEEAIRYVARLIDARQFSPLLGGLAMLVGAYLVQISKSKTRVPP